MDGVGEEGDRPRDGHDRELGRRGRREDDERDLDGPDTARIGGQGVVDGVARIVGVPYQ